jgi:hypothetical protein
MPRSKTKVFIIMTLLSAALARLWNWFHITGELPMSSATFKRAGYLLDLTADALLLPALPWRAGG